MLNKLLSFIRRYQMLCPGDHVTCAVSGGADSVALLFAMYLLREKLGITLGAAHFNHGLRGEESDADEQFVRQLCHRYDIALTVGSGEVLPGKKGLEAAARDARYAFLNSLPGKIATAHTANDNAETVLMHMVRGTGLKGLGGIAPVNGRLIRPMLTVTREEVIAFLEEYHLSYVTDSSNDTDQFLRNRLRHHVMPLLQKENPQIAENLSAMAFRLRQDEEALRELSRCEETPDIPSLKKMPAALRSRALRGMLEAWGVPEPEAEHVRLVERLVFSDKPSAKVFLPNGVIVARRYDTLVCLAEQAPLAERELACPGQLELPELGLKVFCEPADAPVDGVDCFTVVPHGRICVRCRKAGDTMRLYGGTKELKKIYIDRKIPAAGRMQIPVIADDEGILGVYGLGVNRDRLSKQLPSVRLRFESMIADGQEEK